MPGLSDYYTTTENENSKNLWNKKGRQVIVSNILRIRKQFGIGWYLIIAGTYFFEIFLFFFCLMLHKIFTLNKATYTFKNWIDYVKNMGVLLRYFFKILLNKPYFYKVA